jgi:hypothetical protein
VFTRYTDEPWNQTPLKISAVRLGTGHGRHRQIAAFDIHHVAGARMRALHAAAGVYAEHVARQSTVLDGPAPNGVPPIDPSTLVTASGLGDPHGEVTAWVAATSVLSRRVVLVPAAAVWTFGGHNWNRGFVPTAAGTGAGASPAEALGGGLLSVLSYAAIRRAVLGTAEVVRVALDDVDSDAELTFLVRSARNLDVTVELLDLTGAAPAGYVLLARVLDDAGGGPQWAVGADTSWRGAARAALRDLLGGVQLGRQLPSDVVVDTGDPLVDDLEPGTLVGAGGLATRASGTMSWSALLDGLRESGHDALLVPTVPADLRAGGIITARVLLTAGSS